MLDGQFAAQNNSAAPGISVIVAPNGGPLASPDYHKWASVESVKEGRRIQIYDNMSVMDRIVLFVSELCGTAVLVFLGCAACLTVKDNIPNALQATLGFGLAIMIAVQCFGHISGSHINPVVTVAAATLGNISLIQVPIYIIGQIIGGIAGFGLVKLVTAAQYFTSNDGIGPCSPCLVDGVTPFQGFLVEFITSLLLTLVCCAVWDCRNTTNTDSVPLRIGLSITGLALAGVNYTGGHMNPARSFAPALINCNWDNHWVYWIGPLSAGFVGALFYRFLFLKDSEDNENTNAVVVPINDKLEK